MYNLYFTSYWNANDTRSYINPHKQTTSCSHGVMEKNMPNMSSNLKCFNLIKKPIWIKTYTFSILFMRCPNTEIIIKTHIFFSTQHSSYSCSKKQKNVQPTSSVEQKAVTSWAHTTYLLLIHIEYIPDPCSKYSFPFNQNIHLYKIMTR